MNIKKLVKIKKNMDKKDKIILEDLMVLNKELDDIHISMNRINKIIENINEKLKELKT